MSEPTDETAGESEPNNANLGEDTEDKDTPETEPEHPEEVTGETRPNRPSPMP